MFVYQCPPADGWGSSCSSAGAGASHPEEALGWSEVTLRTTVTGLGTQWGTHIICPRPFLPVAPLRGPLAEPPLLWQRGQTEIPLSIKICNNDDPGIPTTHRIALNLAATLSDVNSRGVITSILQTRKQTQRAILACLVRVS